MLEERAPSCVPEEYDLDEHFTSGVGVNPPIIPSRKSIRESTLSSATTSCCFLSFPVEWVLTIQALVTVANIRTYLEATTVMAARLRREATSASPAISRRRQEGQSFPILKRIVGELKSLESVWGSKGSLGDVGTLWWDPTVVEADQLRGGMSLETTGVDCGAYVIGLMVICGLTTDAVYSCGKWLSDLREWNTGRREGSERAATVIDTLYLEKNEAINLTIQAMTYLPIETSQWCVERIANVLSHSISIRITPELKPLRVGILLVPGWAAYVLMGGVNICSSIPGEVLDCVATLARNLLFVCLEDESRFEHFCVEAVRFIGILSNQLVQSAVFSSSAKDILALTSPTQRAVAVLRLVFSTFIQPLEENFRTFVVRPGVSNALWTAFVRLFKSLVVERTLFSLNASSNEVSPTTRICSAILRTALYRLLLVVETLGTAELSKLSGTLHTAHQQKRYKGMLQHSRGKFTVTLLNAIAEDRQLLLEEANMRSPSGHRILKLHNDIVCKDDGHVVLLYLDSGVIYYSVGRRDRNFKVAKGLEEVFKIFQ
ncbi:unnamed protein product [Phytomonas sp. Hart1]|nr:unnamed protein product [Phytomonas sp. Hart1]|eukprot:CCW66726.1 unnamed protein product [Phytomonas sp. isolate Hart1]